MGLSESDRGQLSADQIRQDAVQLAEFDDPEAERFDRNLDALVESLNSEGDLPVSGAAEAHGEFVNAMANRLKTLSWFEKHPEMVDEPIEAPIILTGLPRSGTTFFQQLFDRNEELRLIRTWETVAPCPPPALDPDSVAERVAASVQADEEMRDQIEDFDAIHIRDTGGAEECHNFLAQTFSAIGFHNYMNVPSYAEYLFNELDLEAAYEVHKRQLQLLQFGGPTQRWAVKYPNHLIATDAILGVYPDAKFVMTHRDPVQTLASLCRLTDTFRVPRMRSVNHDEVGPQMLEFVGLHLDRLMDFVLSPMGEERTVHVDYYAMSASPVDALARAYTGLGIEMTEKVRSDVDAWRNANPKGKRGANSYALEDYGLSVDQVVERFRPYIEHFDIPRESSKK